MKTLNRRHFVAFGIAGTIVPPSVLASTARQIEWDDLIPPGIPYSEIVGTDYIDEASDTWVPKYDENARKFNEELDGAYIRMPGYILPLEMDAQGVSEFILVPYVGACIHVPPPPPNQLVLTRTKAPWTGDQLWAPVWVTGTLQIAQLTTEIAEVGYLLSSDYIEAYEW
jgi:hypothetical protein